jgi:hypothetical protein
MVNNFPAGVIGLSNYGKLLIGFINPVFGNHLVVA